MKKRNKIILIVVALTLLIAVLSRYGMYFYLDKFYFPKQIKEIKERKIMLLYETDHSSLLVDCRNLIKEKHEGKWQEGRYNVGFRPHPDTAKLPETILKLKPTWVWVHDERVKIEMFGGLYHFGIQAFSEGLPEAEQEKYGDKKLLDSLWYYDDGYRKSTNYEQQIESLRPE